MRRRGRLRDQHRQPLPKVVENDGAHVLGACLTAKDGGAQRLVEILAAAGQHLGACMGLTDFFCGRLHVRCCGDVFLDRLLDAERSGREERRIRTMLKTAKIPTGATLENFEYAFQPAIERSRIETLATGAWIRNAEVVLMQGPPGVGKSQVSIAGRVRCHGEEPVVTASSR